MATVMAMMRIMTIPATTAPVMAALLLDSVVGRSHSPSQSCCVVKVMFAGGPEPSLLVATTEQV